jgi:hypothetical protein
LSLNFAYERLFSNNEQLNDNLLNYTKKNSTTFLPIQQYLSSTMFKILNEVVNEKIKSTDTSELKIVEPKNKPQHTLQQQQQHQLALKQKRAKRGQYRKYESDQLTKAVEAVINGLMSVHKAGSHFGVPHSTLEYKVKERHIRFSTTTNSTNAASPTITDKNIKPNDKNLFQQHYPTSTTPSSASTSNYFSASDLLRKLYENQAGNKKY